MKENLLIMNSYVDLCVYIFDRNNIEEGLKYILNNIDKENEELNEVLYRLIQNLIKGSDGYHPRFGVSEEFTKHLRN